MISEHVYDTALVEDLERRLGASDLFQWLDHEADHLAQLGYVEKQGVWFSQKLLHDRKIEELRGGISVIGEDASIEVGVRGYLIRYRDDLPRDRMRFSLAHEIGHTYWFDTRDLGKPLSPMQSSSSGASTIEYLCDFFAGALLLPRRQIEKVVTAFVPPEIPPLHLIKSLANDFQVADQAVARRLLFQILPQKVAILKLKKGRASIPETGGEEGWRISWCAVPHALRSAHSVTGLRAPFLTSSRAIPEDMIPNPISDQTERCKIDGRWWEGLIAQSKRESRVPFKSRKPRPGVEAFVYAKKPSHGVTLFGNEIGNEYMYIALPLE